MEKNKQYTVIRDTAEKSGYWDFSENNYCLGTISKHLKTGDYSLENLEDIFTIERKKNTGELSQNIHDSRFERELVRLDKMDQAYLILEFTWKDIDIFPLNSGIPSKFWPKLRVSSKFIKKRLIEIMSDYNIQVIFAGNDGSEVAEIIFKRMSQIYG